MRQVVKIAVQVVQILSLCGTIIAGVLGLIYEIIGHTKFEQLLSRIGISNGFRWIWLVGVTTSSLLIITCYIKQRL